MISEYHFDFEKVGVVMKDVALAKSPQMERYYERKAAGVCTKCGMPPVPGKTLCEKHLAKSRKQSKNYKERQTEIQTEIQTEKQAQAEYIKRNGGLLRRYATATKDHANSIDLSQYQPGDTVRVDWRERSNTNNESHNYLFPSSGVVVQVTKRAVILRSVHGYLFAVSVADLLTGTKITMDEISLATESPESEMRDARLS